PEHVRTAPRAAWGVAAVITVRLLVRLLAVLARCSTRHHRCLAYNHRTARLAGANHQVGQATAGPRPGKQNGQQPVCTQCESNLEHTPKTPRAGRTLSRQSFIVRSLFAL